MVRQLYQSQHVNSLCYSIYLLSKPIFNIQQYLKYWKFKLSKVIMTSGNRNNTLTITNKHSSKISANSLHMLSLRCFAFVCVIWPLEKSNTSSLQYVTELSCYCLSYWLTVATLTARPWSFKWSKVNTHSNLHLSTTFTQYNHGHNSLSAYISTTTILRQLHSTCNIMPVHTSAV